MATYSPMQSVSEGLFALFQDTTLLAIALGGVQTDVPEDPTYPFLWVEVLEQDQRGGFGTKPGVGELPEIGIRLHACDLAVTEEGWRACQRIIARAHAVLYVDDALTVTGYTVCGKGPFHDPPTLQLSDQEIKGVKAKELVSMHRLYIEEAA